MNRLAPTLLAAILFFLLLSPALTAAGGGSLELTVYSDGYVYVGQTLPVSTKATSVQVPLLSGVVSNLVATDQQGSPLSYSFNSGGTNITVYTLGASSVTLRYETDSLTIKNGTVWTLAFAASYNSTVILPQFSTLLSVSGTPYSINETSMSPEAVLSPGPWRIRYGVSLESATSGSSTGTQSTSGTGTRGGPPGTSIIQPWELALVAVVAAALGGLSFVWRRGRGRGVSGQDLRPDDVQVLNFIREKGGRVLEPEIRMKFALPKTSAWRQIKRLERLGYVRVTKIGSQNQIEILKERTAGD